MFFCKKTRKRIAFSESEHNNLVLSPSRMKSCASLYQKSHIQAYIYSKKKSEAKKKKEKLLYNLDNTHHKMSDKLRAFLWTGYQVRGHHGYETNHDHLNFVTANEAEVPTFRHSTIYFTNYKPFFFF